MTWSDDLRVEGYSNLLWILALAFLRLLGISLVDGARALGFLCALTLIGVLVGYLKTTTKSLRGFLLGSTSLLFFCIAGPISIWTIGGLEQPLLCVLILGGMISVLHISQSQKVRPSQRYATGILLGLALLTRSDAVVLLGSILLGALFIFPMGAKTAHLFLAIIGIPIVAFASQLMFRHFYYGSLIPNPALIKVAFTGERLRVGLNYWIQGNLSVWPLWAVALCASITHCLQDSKASKQHLFLWTPIIIWSAYIVTVGGDIFPGWRHLVILVSILTLVSAHGLTQLKLSSGQSKTAFGVLVAGLVLHHSLQISNPENERAVSERWEWDGQIVGVALKRLFHGTRPLLAVDAAGCLPFFSKLPSLDMLGLNDWHIARQRPKDFGLGALAHEHGDGKYVLDRSPDLISFCGPRGGEQPCFRSGYEMIGELRFKKLYHLVELEIPSPRPMRALIWTKTGGAALGKLGRSKHIRIVGDVLNEAEPLFYSADGGAEVTLE